MICSCIDGLLAVWASDPRRNPMKQFLFIFAALAAATPLFASDSTANLDAKNSVAFRIGSNSPLTNIEGQSSDKSGDPGLMFGMEYLHKPAPFLGLGVEYSMLRSGEHASTVLLTNGNSTASRNDQVVLVIAKWLVLPESKFQPFLGVGAGLGTSHLKLTSAPRAGFVWAATGTADRRTIVDSTESAVAIGIRAGADVSVGDSLSFGGELGYTRIGDMTHSVTAQGQQVLPSLVGFKGPSASFQLAGRLAFRF